jgi:hypothetical protein
MVRKSRAGHAHVQKFSTDIEKLSSVSEEHVSLAYGTSLKAR